MDENQRMILRDSWSGAELSLVESIDTPKGEYTNSVVLATLEGPALDYVHDTRNNRGYEEELWDSVAQSDYVQELFETKNFLGEPDHPMQWENRADIHYPYVSHAVRKLYKKPELGCYWVVIDILDTPNGRILKTLIDYGVKLGVSSRGSGRTIIKNGRTIVDPRTYRFITIDIVPMPGNKAARMNNVATNESVKLDGLISALTEQVEFLSESKNLDSLRYTKTLLDRLEYPECDSLLEKVNGILGEDEGNTDANSTQDLVEAYALIADLRNQLDSKDLIIKNLTESVANSSNEQNTLSDLEAKYSKAQELVRSSLMRESELRKQNIELSEKLEDMTAERDDLNESVSSLTKANEVLKGQVHNLKARIDESVSSNSDEMTQLYESCSQKENDIQSLTEQLKFVSDRSAEMSERYFSLRCSQLGVNADLVRKRLGDITAYSADELNTQITESFKLVNGKKSSSDAASILSSGTTYNVRNPKSLNESIEGNAEQAELDRIRQNVAAVRLQ